MIGSIKEFLSEHILTLLAFASTGLLMTGKLALGWSIGWGWVFAPLWIPMIAVVCAVFGLIAMALIATLFISAGVVFFAKTLDTVLDDDFIDDLEAAVAEARETLKEAEAAEDGTETPVESGESEAVH